MEKEFSRKPIVEDQGEPNEPSRLHKYISAGIVGIGIGLILLWGLGRLDGFGGGPQVSEVAPVKGALAPGFKLQDIHGGTVELAELKGKVVLINFWATWCAPCRIEMPAIQSRFERHSPDLVVLAVDFDEPAEIVRDFSQDFGLTFAVLLDPGALIQQLYQVRGYPTSIFVDEEGVIQIVHIGIMADSQLDGYLAEMGLAQ